MDKHYSNTPNDLDRLLPTSVDPTYNSGDCWQSGSTTSQPNIYWYDLEIKIGAEAAEDNNDNDNNDKGEEVYSLHSLRVCHGKNRSNYILRLVTEMKSHTNGTSTRLVVDSMLVGVGARGGRGGEGWQVRGDCACGARVDELIHVVALLA